MRQLIFGLLLFKNMALPNSSIILPCIFSNSLLYTETQVGPCQCFKESWEYFFKLFGKWANWCILSVIIFAFFLVYIYHPICLFLPPLFSVLQFRFIIFSFQLPFTALNFILPLLLCSSRFFFIYDIPIFYVDIVSFVFIGKFHFILTWFCSILLWKYWLFY